MLYEIAHIIKNRFLFLWKVVEWGNATLFYLMHKKKLMEINSVLEQVSNVYRFRTTTEEDVKKLVDFLLVSLRRLLNSSNHMDLTERLSGRWLKISRF